MNLQTGTYSDGRSGARMRRRRGLARIGVIVLLGVVAAARMGAAGNALPNGWTSRDIGKTRYEGATGYANGTFAVASAGRDVRRTSDRFRFAYTTATGDADIVVRLANTINALPGTKTGVMIRTSLDASASNAFMYRSGDGQLAFSRRRADGHDTTTTAGNPADVPVWLKIERRGALVLAYSSPDGVRWTFVGNAQVDWPDTVFLGLAVSSGDAESVAMGVFESATVRQAGSSPGGDAGEDPPEDSTPLPPPDGDPPTASSMRLVFEPSPDHAVVTHYVFEVMVANSLSLIVLRENLGRPRVVNGECEIEVGALLALLPEGRYVGRVKAVSAYGSSEFAYSDRFSL